MRIRLILGQRKCTHEGQYVQEVLDAWDEISLDDNPDGYAERLEKHRNDEDMHAVRELDVKIPWKTIEMLFDVPETTIDVVGEIALLARVQELEKALRQVQELARTADE